jgi:hypothetical protein
MLELAMVLVTITALVAVSIGGSSGGGFRGAISTTAATATQEAIVTVLNRAAADAIEQRGVYSPLALRQGAVGLQVNGLLVDFDCTADLVPDSGQVLDCPVITVGGVAEAAANPGSRAEGQLVAHLTADRRRAIIVTMTRSGRCAVAVGDVEEIAARYVIDADAGVCDIPLEHIR